MAYTPSFVNFSRYLDANRSTAERQAQGLASGVEAEGAKVGTDLDAASAAFDKAADAGTLKYDYQRHQGPYTGPSSLASQDPNAYNALTGRADAAAERARGLQNPYAVQGMLQEQQRGKPYSFAASRFDAGLVGAAGAPLFADMAARFGGLSQRIRDADTASEDRAARARKTGEAREAQFVEAFANRELPTIAQRPAAPANIPGGFIERARAAGRFVGPENVSPIPRQVEPWRFTNPLSRKSRL